MISDRAAGAIMGALIGDALGLGCHWYYDLDEQHKDYGEWISDYTTPKPDRYHGGMKAGQPSQDGLILAMLLRSVVKNKGYEESDFTRRLDEELFPLLDGTSDSGPGGITSQSIRDAYQCRVKEKKSWKETGGLADSTESAERAIVLAALYAKNTQKVSESVSSNCLLTQRDEAIVSMTTAFNCTLSQLIIGEKSPSEISGYLYGLVASDNLPTAVTFSSPDALFTPNFIAQSALDSGVKIEPAWKVSLVYGMPSAIYHVLPAAYYLATRYSDDFESAVLHAINGGGENRARAVLTGALTGAQVGLSGIPRRFIEGLENGEELVELAKKVGELAEL